MSTALTVIWTVVIIAAVVVPVVMLIWLFFKGKALISRGTSTVTELTSLAEETNRKLAAEKVSKPLRGAGVLGRSEDILDARKVRREVAEVRAYRKGKRLENAVGRWRSLGLIAPAKSE